MTQMEANVVDGNTTTDLLKIHGLTRDTTALYLSWAIFLATSFIFYLILFHIKASIIHIMAFIFTLWPSSYID